MVRWTNAKTSIPALIVGLSGALSLLTLPLKGLPLNSYSWLPFNPYHFATATTLTLGLGLIYIAFQLYRKRQNAYRIAIVSLGLLTVIQIVHSRVPEQTLLYAVGLLFLYYNRSQYTVKHDVVSLQRTIILTTIMLFTIVLFASYTFARIDQVEYGKTLTTSETLRVTLNAMLGDPIPAELRPTGHDRNLLFSLQASFIAAVATLLSALFYPVGFKKRLSARGLSRAEKILKEWSASSEDYLKLWPKDKHYFFYEDSFLAYGHARGIAMVLDGAAGNPQKFNTLRAAFLKECHTNAWQVSVLHADTAERDEWAKLGVKGIYLGSEARVHIRDFCENRVRDKHFRYINNKATKDGLKVREVAMPLNAKSVKELRIVSDEWLTAGRREYAFMMGYFDRQYLAKCRIFAVYKGNEMVAYTNLLPSFTGKDMSIDHMRFKRHVSPATMHFLLLKTIIALNESGAETLNLGLSPLSKLDENTDRVTKAVLSTVRRLGGRYYSFAGLEQFKGKFGPQWEPTYLLYSNLQNLALVGAAVNKLTTHREFAIPKLPLFIAAIAGATYASFPLALLVNPDYAFKDYVSTLGQSNQPFSWIFNSLDLLSSVLVIGLSAFLIKEYWKPVKLLKIGLYSLIVSALGTLLAAVFSLPESIDNPSIHDLDNIHVLTHVLFSTVNTLGYLTTVGLWAWHFYKVQGFNLRHYLAFVISVFALFSLAFEVFEVSAGIYVQRLLILSYAGWLVWFIFDVVTTHAPRYKL